MKYSNCSKDEFIFSKRYIFFESKFFIIKMACGWTTYLVKNKKSRKISCKSLLHCGHLKELPELKYLYYSEKATRVSFN